MTPLLRRWGTALRALPKRLSRVRPRTILIHVVAWGIGLVWLVPFLGVLMVAVRPFDEVVDGWWNFSEFHPTLQNFGGVWAHDAYPISDGLRNSALVAIPGTIIPILVASIAAYGFARFHFRTRDYLFLTIVLLMAVPQQMVAVPIFQTMVNLGLVDNFVSLILIHSAWGIPWILLFLRNFFQTLPLEVEEAARVDGASDFKIFYRIVLPMALPALAAVAVLQLMWVWNDFFFAEILMISEGNLLATQRVPRLISPQALVPWDLLSASSILVMLVPVLIYALLQRYYIRGMIGWTIKG